MIAGVKAGNSEEELARGVDDEQGGGVYLAVEKEMRGRSTSHSLCGSGCEWKNVSSREEQLGWFWVLLGCWVGSTLFLFFLFLNPFPFLILFPVLNFKTIKQGSNQFKQHPNFVILKLVLLSNMNQNPK